LFKRHFGWGLILILAVAASLQAQFNILYSFRGGTTDGRWPYGSVLVVGSTLYGMTYSAGSSNRGTIFKINMNGTGYTVLHHFAGGATDGAYPVGALIMKNSILYGLTTQGGSSGNGTLFRMKTNGSGYKVLHMFAGSPLDGECPDCSLVVSGSWLYGTTNLGGLADKGTVFRVNLNGTGFKVLRSFAGGTTDGEYPTYSTPRLYNGKLYGMAYAGGANGSGVIYTINLDGTGFKPLHSFGSGTADGQDPCGSLIVNSGKLYGMTLSGGAGGYGTIFKINPNGTGYARIHSFAGGASDGAYSYGTLTAGGTKLYGMTNAGGSGNAGVIFEINTNGTGFKLLHSFVELTETNGSYPYGSLVRKVTTQYGTRLYGMTRDGGASGLGVIFFYTVK